MGAIDETRKLVQDFLAPELREIKVRLEALEQKTGARFVSLEASITARIEALERKHDARFDAQDKLSAARHEAVMNALTGLTNYAALSERLARLETEREQKSH